MCLVTFLVSSSIFGGTKPSIDTIRRERDWRKSEVISKSSEVERRTSQSSDDTIQKKKADDKVKKQEEPQPTRRLNQRPKRDSEESQEHRLKHRLLHLPPPLLLSWTIGNSERIISRLHLFQPRGRLKGQKSKPPRKAKATRDHS